MVAGLNSAMGNKNSRIYLPLKFKNTKMPLQNQGEQKRNHDALVRLGKFSPQEFLLLLIFLPKEPIGLL